MDKAVGERPEKSSNNEMQQNRPPDTAHMDDQKAHYGIPSNEITALLDQGVSFEGKMTFEGTVRLGGEFKGEIFTRDTLVIDAEAKVDAQIEADTVILSGTVRGNIFARRQVTMHPPAYFKGTVTTPSLRIDEGVVFEGASYMPKHDDQ